MLKGWVLLVAAASSVAPLYARVQVHPAADHHGHLQSVAVWHLFNEQLPIVSVPGDFDRLLREFERGWHAPDNKAALADLFIEDGLFHYGDDWLRGRAAIRMMLLGHGGPLRLRAQAVEASETHGHLAGAYGWYRDTTWVDQGRFVLALRRPADGPWRIAVGLLSRTSPPIPPVRDPYSAEDYIATLDSAGVRRGVVLSWAYQIAAQFRRVSDEAAKVRAENDWTGRQAARYPERLVAFCSLNPLREYALDELAHCMRDPRIRGLKLHLTTSFVDLRVSGHTRRLADIFEAANRGRFPIVIHMRTMNPAYGRPEAEIFLREVLARAPDVPVQIAHLGGWGGYGRGTDEALGMLAEAVSSGDRRAAHLVFDLSSVVDPGMSEDTKRLIVRRIRQIGVERMLFGVDRADAPAKVWENLSLLPLEREEILQVARNLAPYLR
jgi:predicted TIM-barrel fold metal-dependent hydrolase